jgi:NAD(P)-dependent dehydrogenase (short-subunit alcohol dehydrogenase family)
VPTAARRALVTGGSRGIGLATGQALVQAGYEVVLNARNPDRLRTAAETVGARWCAGDSADPVEFAAAIETSGPVDLLVHAAGTMDGTFVRKETPERFAAVVRTNLISAFVVSHLVLPVMPAGGRIIFLSSSSAHSPQPGRSAYTASKAGLNGFAGALAREVERDGIAVHVVTTGPVATPMLDDVHFPMRTLAVDDVVRTILWLDTLPPNAAIPELVINSVDSGPFALPPFVPEAARRLGRTELPPA